MKKFDPIKEETKYLILFILAITLPILASVIMFILATRI